MRTAIKRLAYGFAELKRHRYGRAAIKRLSYGFAAFGLFATRRANVFLQSENGGILSAERTNEALLPE